LRRLKGFFQDDWQKHWEWGRPHPDTSQGAPAMPDDKLCEPHIILRCVVGSRAYGLEGEGSDTDRRGIYLPPASLHWSLDGVPGRLTAPLTQDCCWELNPFLLRALKATPIALECLHTPLVEHATPLAQELLAMRDCFLSKLAHESYKAQAES